MSLKPPKKSDLNKQWMKRQSQIVLIQPEFHLIITEGTKTEPNYFEGIKNNINQNFRDKIQLEIYGEGDNTLGLLTLNRHALHCVQPQVIGKLRHRRILLSQFRNESLHSALPCHELHQLCIDLIELLFDLIVAVDQFLPLFVVFGLVLYPSCVLSDQLLQHSSYQNDLGLKLLLLCGQLVGIEKPLTDPVKLVKQFITLSEDLIESRHELADDLFLSQMRRSALTVSAVFSVASPNYSPILVFAVPHFGTVDAAAVSADNLP